jgi:hypothetical protein
LSSISILSWQISSPAWSDIAIVQGIAQARATVLTPTAEGTGRSACFYPLRFNPWQGEKSVEALELGCHQASLTDINQDPAMVS